MDTRVLMALVFIAGLSGGWLGKTWLGPAQSKLQPETSSTNTDARSDSVAANSTQAANSTLADSKDVNLNPASRSELENQFEDQSTNMTVVDNFKQLLSRRLYFDAMVLYHEQVQQKGDTSAQLKKILVMELRRLLDSKNNSDFSELVDNYLSIYYDDIDILLMLANFNKANGSYLEVVDVYLLAKTYAYSDIDQTKVEKHFNSFVEEMDSLYTKREDWWALINIYTHIETSGLMTPTYQYWQAIAHLRSGDEVFAIDQLNKLLSDSVVGESAAITLNDLQDNALANSTQINIPEANRAGASAAWVGAESIDLEKRGNQYLINITNNRQGSVKLLIDTGASMTVVSIASFDSLNVNGDAIEQDRRVFRTAGGVVMGTVFSVPELRLGPYLLTDTQVAVIDFDAERDFDGLLGMNILGNFRFQIDQDNTRLLLSKK